MRTAEYVRKTRETDIQLKLNLDGSGESSIDTGVGFFDHMLTLFSFHGKFDLTVKCKGDIHVDAHHTVEDVGIALGRAFDQALNDRRGIARYGEKILPMDESLVLTALDISGRTGVYMDLPIPDRVIGAFATELVEEFFWAFARGLAATIHIRKLAGGNSHHLVEAAFKGFGRALGMAVKVESNEIPSSKGVLL